MFVRYATCLVFMFVRTSSFIEHGLLHVSVAKNLERCSLRFDKADKALFQSFLNHDLIKMRLRSTLKGNGDSFYCPRKTSLKLPNINFFKLLIETISVRCRAT